MGSTQVRVDPKRYRFYKSNQFLQNAINEKIIMLWMGELEIPELLRRE